MPKRGGYLKLSKNVKNGLYVVFGVVTVILVALLIKHLRNRERFYYYLTPTVFPDGPPPDGAPEVVPLIDEARAEADAAAEARAVAEAAANAKAARNKAASLEADRTGRIIAAQDKAKAAKAKIAYMADAEARAAVEAQAARNKAASEEAYRTGKIIAAQDKAKAAKAKAARNKEAQERAKTANDECEYKNDVNSCMFACRYNYLPSCNKFCSPINFYRNKKNMTEEEKVCDNACKKINRQNPTHRFLYENEYPFCLHKGYGV